MTALRKTDPMLMVHRQWRPRYESRPYRMHPDTRLHVHGRIEPMDSEQSWPAWLKWLVSGFAVWAALLLIGVM